MAVDFVKSDGGQNKPKQSGYDIEYTNPQGDQVETTKPKHGNLLGFFHKAASNPNAQPVVPPSTNPIPGAAVSATAPTATVKPKQSYQPVSQATPAPVIKTRVPVDPQPKAAALPERHLPPAPPPPLHATQPPVQPVAPLRSTLPTPPPVKPVAPPPPPPPQPHAVTQPAQKPLPKPLPKPMSAPMSAPAVAQPAPIQSAGPVGTPVAASAHHATSVGQIVAQNVSAMRGAATDPAAPHPSLLDLNLLPSGAHKPLHQASAIFRLFRTATLTVMVLTTVYLALVCYQAFFVWRTHTALAELNTLDSTILSYRTLQTDINTTSDTLTAIQDLLNEHIYWTQWFSFLERQTLSTVYYTNFSGSSSGVMNLEATAPDFSTIAQQLAVFQALPEVQAVEVATATRSGTADATTGATGAVNFTISLQVDPAVLRYQPRGIYGE